MTLLSCTHFQCLEFRVLFINGKDWTRRNLSAQNRRRGRKEGRKEGRERRREEKRKKGRGRVWGKGRKGRGGEGSEGRRERKGRMKKLGWKEKMRHEMKGVGHQENLRFSFYLDSRSC